MIKYSDLSKIVSHALRHEPWLYELEMDDEGWVNIDMILPSLRLLNSEWKDLSEKDLVEMMQQSDKQRFSIEAGKIKALYGHSLPGQLIKTPATPPLELFHGTSSEYIDNIHCNGLLPMKRQYVHLAIDIETARQVGLRKDKNPIILKIFAKTAHDFGIKFYEGNTHVWLAHEVPAKFIDFI